MTSPDLDFKGVVFLILGPVAFLIPSYMPLTLLVSAASWMVLQRSVQYSFIIIIIMIIINSTFDIVLR